MSAESMNGRGYELKITNSEETIEFSTKEFIDVPPILAVEFRMNTLNDNTINRADSVRVELMIKGLISDAYRNETLKLAKWALDNDRQTLYRNLELIVYADQQCSGEILRSYVLDSMFVIDYKESFPQNDSNETGYFDLFIAQKAGNVKKAVYAG